MDVIRITLHSDLCAGNGESRGNAVDTDIVLTAAGLPRIPARRLKGCLRAAAGELAALGDEAAAYTAELFGDKVGRQGCLWVGDAALPQEAAFTAWLKQNPAWADHSRVEQLYTDVRGQTRLKDGVADDGSLRFTRVLGQYDPLDKTKALVFEASVRLENASPEAVRLLEHCCAATRHMGTHRNRGLGNVRLAYIRGAGKPAAPQNPALPDAGMVTLTYHVQLKMPLTLPGCGEQLTAIPARSVIGCLAGAYLRQGTAADAAFRQLFLDGTARWSPLTPVIGGEVSYPAPLALVYLKNDGVYANRCAETPTGKQKTLSGVYTAPGKNGLLAASVPTITTYHHKHRDANSDATLYMQQAVQAGLVYGGTVTLPTALAGRAAALLSTAPLRFGRSKTAQYAVCELLGRITAAPVQEAQVTVRKGEPFFVLLETDLILDTDAPTPETAGRRDGGLPGRMGRNDAAVVDGGDALIGGGPCDGLIGGVLRQDRRMQRPGHAVVQDAALLLQRHAGWHDHSGRRLRRGGRGGRGFRRGGLGGGFLAAGGLGRPGNLLHGIAAAPRQAEHSHQRSRCSEDTSFIYSDLFHVFSPLCLGFVSYTKAIGYAAGEVKGQPKLLDK